MQGRTGTRQVTVSAKKVRVAINGFGRIGRQFLRCWEGRGAASNLEVVCVNDSGGVKQASHLLKYDSTMGTFKADVQVRAAAGGGGGRQLVWGAPGGAGPFGLKPCTRRRLPRSPPTLCQAGCRRRYFSSSPHLPAP